MVDVDRMVGRLGELVQDADIATGNGSRREYSHAELFPIDRLWTAEGEENATWFDLAEGLGIEPFVALQSIA